MSKIKVVLYGKEGEVKTEFAPETEASQVYIASESGNPSTVEEEINVLRQKTGSIVSGGVVFKGSLTSTSGLPTVMYKAGWQYVVKDAGTYAGKVCEEGDMVLCIKDYASGSASNSDWTVIQVNIQGAVTGPASSVANRVAIFDGTSGKIIKDSGFTIGKSVPADAEFTDTTYAPVTSSADGLMTIAQKTKLDSIEAGADKTDTANVASAGAVMKTDTSDKLPQGTTNLYMTSAERTKLSGISAGAEKNQNAFNKITVDGTAVTASSPTATMTINTGDGLSATVSGTTVTINENYIDSCIVSSLDDVPANLRNGGLIILKTTTA